MLAGSAHVIIGGACSDDDSRRAVAGVVVLSVGVNVTDSVCAAPALSTVPAAGE